MQEIMRLFIAIPIEASLRAAMSKLTIELRKSGGKVKWVEEENFHITLKFLGNTPEERVPAIEKAMSDSLQSFLSFRIDLGGLGGFPNLIRPRVFWVGIQKGAKHLENIAKSIDEASSRLGYEKEIKRFRSHLTIGRVKDSGNLQGLIEKINNHSGFKPGGMEVKEIHLIQSRLSKKGPQYNTLYKHELHGS